MGAPKGGPEQILSSGKSRRMMASNLQVMSTVPDGNAPSGVSRWGMKGPMPTISGSKRRMKARSRAMSAGVCHGEPTMKPHPT